MLVDTHCHLTFDAFEQDRSDVLARARAAGVKYILNPAVDLESSRQALALAEAEADVWAAVGIHPNDAGGWDETALPVLRELARHPENVAIGEIGLDYYWDATPHSLQQDVFRRQLDLAAELGLPVVIHTRNRSSEDRTAMQDALDVLTAWQTALAQSGSPLAQHPGVLHSFSGNAEEARQATVHNFYIGVTGPVTFRKASESQSVIAGLPLERVLIETDAPFLSPHPYRGRRNEPAYVSYIADKIAELHNQPVEIIAHITTQNAERLFFGE